MIFINGQFIDEKKCAIMAQDRGLLLGDGIFTTIKYAAAQLCFFDEHCQRLCHSAKQLFLRLEYSRNDLLAICQELMTRSELQASVCALRITLTRGVSRRGLTIDPDAKATLLVTVSPYQRPQATAERLHIATIRRHSSAATSHHKTLNYLDAIIAKQQALDAGFTDALLLNEKGCFTSTSTGNFFMLVEGTLLTPSLDCGVLNGIMRTQVIKQCQKIGVAVHQVPLLPQQLAKVDAAFMTNSLIGVRPIAQVEQHVFPNDSSIISRLQAELN